MITTSTRSHLLTSRKVRLAIAVCSLVLPLSLVSCSGDSEEASTAETAEETAEETVDLTKDPSYAWCKEEMEGLLQLSEVLEEPLTAESSSIQKVIDAGVAQGDITNQEACDAAIEEAFDSPSPSNTVESTTPSPSAEETQAAPAATPEFDPICGKVSAQRKYVMGAWEGYLRKGGGPDRIYFTSDCQVRWNTKGVAGEWKQKGGNVRFVLTLTIDNEVVNLYRGSVNSAGTKLTGRSENGAFLLERQGS